MCAVTGFPVVSSDCLFVFGPLRSSLAQMQCFQIKKIVNRDAGVVAGFFSHKPA